MRKIITEYISKNNLRFHHSISTKSQNDQDKLTPESHQMFEIILLISGQVKYNIEGQSYELSPLDAIIIHPNKLHSREIDQNLPYERMVLHFSPDLLPVFTHLNVLSNYYNNALLPSVLPKKIVEQSNFISLMQECENLCKNKNKYTDLHFVGLILKIIEALNEIILKLDNENALIPVKVDKISHECIQFIYKNLTSKNSLSVNNIARELNVSLSHLQHTFKKQTGVNLHAYIFEQRMLLAKKLLLQGQSPQTVANMLNYEYYSTFYHGFIKYFGIQPHCFVQKHKNT